MYIVKNVLKNLSIDIIDAHFVLRNWKILKWMSLKITILILWRRLLMTWNRKRIRSILIKYLIRWSRWKKIRREKISLWPLFKKYSYSYQDYCREVLASSVTVSTAFVAIVCLDEGDWGEEADVRLQGGQEQPAAYQGTAGNYSQLDT